jgi:hypothetical protein
MLHGTINLKNLVALTHKTMLSFLIFMSIFKHIPIRIEDKPVFTFEYKVVNKIQMGSSI